MEEKFLYVHPSCSPVKAEKAPDIDSQAVALQCKGETQLCFMFAEKERKKDKEKHSKGIGPAVFHRCMKEAQMTIVVHGLYHLKEVSESHSCVFLSVRNHPGYWEHLKAGAGRLGISRVLSFQPLQFGGRNYLKMT